MSFSLDSFQRNGFAGPLPILSQDQAGASLVQVYRELCLTLSECKSSAESPSHNLRFKSHLFLSEINRIVHNPTLLQAARQALDTQHIVLWSSDINVKQPVAATGDTGSEYFSAHQDATYTGLQPADQCLTVWVALSDPVGVNEGCLEFLQQSHKLGQLPHTEHIATKTTCADKNGRNLLSRGQEVQLPAEIGTVSSNNDWVAIPLRAGEATLHHFHTVHRSGHNRHPTKPRVGLALRYMADHVRQTGPVRECATWIDYFGHDAPSDSSKKTVVDDDDKKRRNERRKAAFAKFFDMEPMLPTENASTQDIDRGRDAHQDAMQREEQNYFHDSKSAKNYDYRS